MSGLKDFSDISVSESMSPLWLSGHYYAVFFVIYSGNFNAAISSLFCIYYVVIYLFLDDH